MNSSIPVVEPPTAPPAVVEPPTARPPVVEPPTRREMLLFVLALVAGVALLRLFGGDVLWTRPLWLDERCCVFFNVSEASNPIQVIVNVAHGEVGPPLLHLIVWSVTRIAGLATPVLRSISLVAVCLAMVVVYATLRRRVGSLSSAAAVAALATPALVVEHSFEIRFYGLWLLFASSYAWSLGLDPDAARSRRRDVAVAAFSILVCTIHWFGVISLGFMALAVVTSRGRRWREGLRLVAPSLAGFIVLLACTPMLPIQFRAGPELYWIPPLSFQQVKNMTRWFLVQAPVVIAVLLLLVDRLRAMPRAPVRASLRDPSFVALFATALMPVGLYIVSAVAKPVVWPRYAIVAFLAWAPLVALSVESLWRVARIAVLALMLVMVTKAVRREMARMTLFSAITADYQHDMAIAKRARIPIVFQNYFIMYMVEGAERRQTPARFLDLPDSSIASLVQAPPWQTYLLVRDRNMSGHHERTFGFPPRVTLAKLDSAQSFYLIAAEGALPAGYQNAGAFGQVIFPRYEAIRRSPYVTEFRRIR